MKKIFMTLAAAIIAVSANAQIWAGGELGFTSEHLNGVGTETVVTVRPEVGYSINEDFDIAVSLGFSHSSDKLNKNLAGNTKFFANTFEVNPYVRYKFFKAGNFFAFVDGGVGYAATHYSARMNGQKFSKNENMVGVSIVPGIAYSVSNKVTLVSHLGEGLYYSHQWMKDYYHVNSFGCRLFNGITFGAYYNF